MTNKTSKHNKSLYFLSLLSIIIILTGLYYGFNITQSITFEKENQLLKYKVDSLSKLIKK
jgi:uncharacterized membrane protein